MSEKQTLLLPWIIAIAMFMDTLDSTIVGVAIPHIAASFNINPVNMKLALTSYLLSLAIFIPISGWLADKYGEKKIFMLAMGIFTLSSLGCALSPNLACLVFSRLVQGFGGALMMPVGRLIILRNYPGEELAKAMNTVVVPGLIGPALGPTIGGIILQVATWHWIFLVNIPFGILGIVVAYFLLSKEKSAINVPPFHWIGFLCFSLGLTLLTFALALLGDNFNWRQAALVLAILSGFFLLAYAYFSKKQTRPLLDLHLFHNNAFAVAMSVSFLSRIAIGAIPFLLPLLLQILWDHTALYSGTVFIFYALGMMSTRLFINRRILTKIGHKRWLIIVISLQTFLLMNLCWFSTPQPFIWLASLIFFIGMFTTQLFLTINTLYPKYLKPEQYSQGTSISSTIQQFSAGVGVASAAIMLHLIAKISHRPLFSSSVFFWTFIFLNMIGALSLLCVLKLKENRTP